MTEIEVIDHLGDFWRFLVPPTYKRNPNGMWIMWVYVAEGPDTLAMPPYHYQQIPLPLFTEWWND
jgi:hypothetical protein